MPRCPNCDERVSANETECPHCGEGLSESASGKAESKSRNANTSNGNTILLIVLGAGVLGMLCCGGILLGLTIPAVQQTRETARRALCKNNLKQIGLAMQNYHDTVAMFPAAHLKDAQGKPRLSWRVSILPYLGQAPLYNIYNFSDVWDGPSNARIASTPVPVYICPSYNTPTITNTCYVAVSGDHTILGAGKCVRMGEIKDGTSNTLMVVESCGMNIPWLKPQDLDEKAVTRVGDPNGMNSKHVEGVHALLGDGSVRFISNDVSEDVIQALITRDGGEQPVDY